MSLQQRLMKLEQAQTSDAGAGVLGYGASTTACRPARMWLTIPAIGERMTVAEFEERYPGGLLILRMEYADTATGDEAA